MNVFVTGARGFVGSHLARHLAQAGHRVAGSSSGIAGAGSPASVERLVPLPLGEPIPAQTFAGVDALIHCAHDLRPGSTPRNVAGTRASCEAAEADGVAYQLYVGSYSGRSDAVSEYGRSKQILSEYFRERGHAVVVPGLVVGPGGAFARMADSVMRWPLLPLVDGGRHPVPFVGIGVLQQVVQQLLEARRVDTVRAYSKERPTLREVLETVRRCAGRRTIFVPLPSALLIPPLWIAQRAGLKLPLGIDSLRGYRLNATGPEGSDLGDYVAREPSLAETVRAAIQS